MAFARRRSQNAKKILMAAGMVATVCCAPLIVIVGAALSFFYKNPRRGFAEAMRFDRPWWLLSVLSGVTLLSVIPAYSVFMSAWLIPIGLSVALGLMAVSGMVYLSGYQRAEHGRQGYSVSPLGSNPVPASGSASAHVSRAAGSNSPSTLSKPFEAFSGTGYRLGSSSTSLPG